MAGEKINQPVRNAMDSHLAEGSHRAEEDNHLVKDNQPVEDNHPVEDKYFAEDIHQLGAVEDIEAGPLGSIVALTSLYPDLATISFS